jgi:hypothetical protein
MCCTCDLITQVYAYELLIEKLLLCKGADDIPAGQVYCISDGSPVENFEFLRPLCEARGKAFPKIVLPTSLMLEVALALEVVYQVSNALGWPIEPFLTRAEVYKVGVSHYFSIAKAQRELGYEPKISSEQGAQKLARRFRRSLSNENYFDMPSAPWWAAILAGMGLLGIVAYADPHGATLQLPVIKQVNWLGLTIFGSQRNLQYMFVAAVVTHCCEAVAAMWLATVEGCKGTWGLWGVQTALLGYPSLRLLYERRRLLREGRAEQKTE